MSLRSRVGELARQEATKVARSICNIMIKQSQQSQTGAMTVVGLNNDGTVKVRLPDGTEQNMTYNGNKYPMVGSVVFQQGPGIVN